MENIILCGFMGSGKSSVGPALAKLTHRKFIDMDDYIETCEKMKIPDIFEISGEEYFRGLEHKTALELAAMDGLIIASGGGALMRVENVEAFKTSGIIVFLNASFDDCYDRIQKSDRPIVKRSTREQLQRLYNERAQVYRRVSGIEIAAIGGVDEIARIISEKLHLLP